MVHVFLGIGTIESLEEHVLLELRGAHDATVACRCLEKGATHILLRLLYIRSSSYALRRTLKENVIIRSSKLVEKGRFRRVILVVSVHA